MDEIQQRTPVFDVSSPGKWDSHFLDTPDWIKDSSGYKMYYFGDDDNNSIGSAIGLATSTDGIHWNRHGTQPILSPGNIGDWDGLYIESPTVVFDGSSYFMWYSGIDSSYQVKIGVATSTDGIAWVKYVGNPIIEGGSLYSWEGFSVATPTVLKRGSKFEMWYCGVSFYDILDNNNIDTIKVGYASSMDGFNWTKYASNPVMGTYDSPYSTAEYRGPWVPDVTYRDSSYYMWYETAYGFGLATSVDEFLSVEEDKSDRMEFLIYPNPSSEKVTIHFPSTKSSVLQLRNSMGSLLLEKEFITETQLDIASLPIGLYFINLKENPSSTQKLIKE